MSKMKHCQYCDRPVRPMLCQARSSFITQIFKGAFHIVMTIITVGLYLIIYSLSKTLQGKEMVCPICNARM